MASVRPQQAVGSSHARGLCRWGIRGPVRNKWRRTERIFKGGLSNTKRIQIAQEHGLWHRLAVEQQWNRNRSQLFFLRQSHVSMEYRFFLEFVILGAISKNRSDNLHYSRMSSSSSPPSSSSLSSAIGELSSSCSSRKMGSILFFPSLLASSSLLVSSSMSLDSVSNSSL